MKYAIIFFALGILALFILHKKSNVSIEETPKSTSIQYTTKNKMDIPKKKKETIIEPVVQYPNVVSNSEFRKEKPGLQYGDVLPAQDGRPLIINLVPENEQEGASLVEYERWKEDKALVQHDIIVDLPKDLPKDFQNGLLRLPVPKLWRDGIVPYEIDPQLPNKKRVVEAIDYLKEQTVVQFIKRRDEDDYVYFTTGSENCYSNLGKQGGKQDIVLADGCGRGEILHEMLHALGLFHEHGRPDRDDYIAIHWQNIEKKYWPQFIKVEEKFFLGFDVPFDFQSIMLYSSNSFAKNSKFLSISRLDGDHHYSPLKDKLSELDKEKIRRLY